MPNETGESTSFVRRILGLPKPAWIICIGMFISKFGNFLSVFLVLYLTAKGYSTFLAGLALGAIGLGSFFGNAVGGTVADRIGRRWAIVASMFGSAALTLLVPVTPNIYLVIGLCTVIGFFAQLYRPAGGAILVDTVAPEDRVAAFGLLRLAINLGMSVGPLVGGLLSTVSYNYLFIGNALASFLFGLLVLLMLPETKPAPAAGEQTEDRAGGRSGYRQVFTDPAMRLYLLAMITGTYVYVQTNATLPLHVREVHLSNQFYGLLLGINAFVIVLLELPLVKFTERRNPRRVMSFGLALLALGVGATGLADTRATLIATVIVWTFAEMIYTPVATAYPGTLAPEHLRGRYQGAEGIAITIAQTAGPALGGFLYGVSVASHWLACGLFGLLAAVLILAARPAQAQTPATAVVPEGAAAAES